MTKNSEKIEDRENISSDAAVEDFVSRLTNEHKMLVVLKAQLYGGRWESMLDDLNNLLAGFYMIKVFRSDLVESHFFVKQ